MCYLSLWSRRMLAATVWITVLAVTPGAFAQEPTDEAAAAPIAEGTGVATEAAATEVAADGAATPAGAATEAVVPDQPAPEEAAVEEPAPAYALLDDVNTLWTALAAFLVFFMQAGFALVETGLTRAKNAGNICMKNYMDFCIGTIAFWLVGYGLMFGPSDGFIGQAGWMYEGAGGFDWAFFLFQLVFCATAATIVSGAMAERTKFSAYLCYSTAISLVVYPVFGGWAWNSLAPWSDGKGWLEARGFLDFAGSTVVHSVGGWAALAGAIMVGPRLGRYKDGKVNPIPGHSLPLACLGVFILWLGWFGFNPGSTTAVGGGNFADIAVTTNAAAAAGGIVAMLTAWLKFGKPDVSLSLNGALAGLVAITAGCAYVSALDALIVGALAGGLVVFAVLFFDKLRIDDPVGAISVHGVCGSFGTLCVGLFTNPAARGTPAGTAGLLHGGDASLLLTQATGVGTAFLWSFGCSIVIFGLIKATIGLRVSATEEIEGLDIHEHGAHAYPQIFTADPLVGTGVKTGLPVSAGLPSLSPASATH